MGKAYYLGVQRCDRLPASTSTVRLNGRTAPLLGNAGTDIRRIPGRLNTYICQSVVSKQWRTLAVCMRGAWGRAGVIGKAEVGVKYYHFDPLWESQF